jgi:hypothetical protein
MKTSLDVLLIETRPDAGSASEADLSAAGHRVHRCYPTVEPDPGSPRLCTALTAGACPLDDGAIDVALVAGPATIGERDEPVAAVTCALRHHVPIVADDSCTSCFGPWMAARANADVVAACEAATEGAFDDLETDILRRLAPVVASQHLPFDAIDACCAMAGPRLQVTLIGPPLDRAIRHVLSVRVLDAVRSAGRVFGAVDVSYELTAA